MTKDYIKDNGKVRLCTSNVAKMNLFESMYYHRFMIMAWWEIKRARKEMKRHEADES